MKPQIALLACLLGTSAMAQQPKLYVPMEFQHAVARESRTNNGFPGKNYFQNQANYQIKAAFNPATGELTGSEEIKYKNNSPDTLGRIVVRLYNNIFKATAARQMEVDKADIGYGVDLQEVVIDGVPVSAKNITILETNAYIKLSKKIAKGSTATLSIKWKTKMPQVTQLRVGKSCENTYFVGYWYPQISVYDDINGWSCESYTGFPEFYNDFNNYEVHITLPKGVLAWATGEQQYRESIFSSKILARIAKAEKSDSTVQIIEAADYKQGGILRPDQSTTWHFKAQNVTDFAFGVSDRYVWDGCSIPSANNGGKRVLVSAVYNKDSKAGTKVADIARYTLDRFANDILGVSYPYPNMTVFEGGDSGMEFPMMCHDEPTEDMLSKVFVTAHEVGHSYFPFMVGTNETLYGWIDEGLMTVIPKVVDSTYGNKDPHYYLSAYSRRTMGTSNDVPSIVPTPSLSASIYMMQNYGRAAAGFYFLRDMMGARKFQEVLKEFVRRWQGKHPTPTDLINTINNYTKNNYTWYWNKWFNEYGYADIMLKSVKKVNNKYNITVCNNGYLPVPLNLRIRYVDGTTKIIYKSAAIWEKTDMWYYTTPENKDIELVAVGDDNIPDANIFNNTFMVMENIMK